MHSKKENTNKLFKLIMKRNFKLLLCWHLEESSRAGAGVEGRGAALGQGRRPSASLTYIANVTWQGRRQPPTTYRLKVHYFLLGTS